MEAALWIAIGTLAGAGWGLCGGYLLGQRNAARAPVEELRRMKLDVDDALEKTSHLQDRIRKRRAPDGQDASPAGQPMTKEELRRRARELGKI